MGRHTGSLRRQNGGDFKPIKQEDFIGPGARKAQKPKKKYTQPVPIGSTAHRFGRKV